MTKKNLWREVVPAPGIRALRDPDGTPFMISALGGEGDQFSGEAAKSVCPKFCGKPVMVIGDGENCILPPSPNTITITRRKICERPWEKGFRMFIDLRDAAKNKRRSPQGPTTGQRQANDSLFELSDQIAYPPPAQALDHSGNLISVLAFRPMRRDGLRIVQSFLSSIPEGSSGCLTSPTHQT